MIKHPNKQTYRDSYFMYYLLGNPALPREVIESPTVYPRVILNYDFNYFSYYSRINQLKISKPSSEHSSGPTAFPFKNQGEIGLGVHEL